MHLRVFHGRADIQQWQAGLGGQKFLEFSRSDGFHIRGCNISFLRGK